MSSAQEFFARLEAERNDLTYLKPKLDKFAPVVVDIKKESRQARQRRDATFFDGGRYAEGARDPKAVAAWKRLNKNV